MAKRKISKTRRNLYQQARRWQIKFNQSLDAGIGNIAAQGTELFNYSKVAVSNKSLQNLSTAQIRKVIETLKYRASGEVVRITVNNKLNDYLELLNNINPEASKAVAKLMKGKSLRYKMIYMSKNRNVFTSIWDSDQILEYIRKNDMFDEVTAMQQAELVHGS